MVQKYQLASDTFDQQEIQAAIDVLHSGKYTMGEKVREFEVELAKWLGVKHALFVNSGSSANLVVVEALMRRSEKQNIQLQPGDEILVPALSWPTTVWPLVQLGLKPVYVDIDPKTLAISLESAQKAVSPKTKGMFLIHVLGRAVNGADYVNFCKKNGLVFFEDCCESFGAYSQGQHVGSFGFAGTLSHFFSHHLTTIEGGSVISNDDSLVDDLKSIRAHGWVRDRSDKQKWASEYPQIDPRFMFIMTGYNVRPMELQAAIGLVQLKKMDQMLDARTQVVQSVNDILKKSTPWLQVIGEETLKGKIQKRNQREHSWMSIPLMLKKEAPAGLTQVKNFLEESGVETRPIIAGNMARHPVSKSMDIRASGDLAQCDAILDRGFMIGCHPNATEAQIETLHRAVEGLKKL